MIKELKLRGHIIDSLILSKLLDEISSFGVECYTKDVKVGAKREDVSEAIFVIESNDDSLIAKSVEFAKKHGAMEI